MSDNFKVFLTRLYEIELPQFTYYQGMSRQTGLPDASRSTSQNVRLYDDTESSPFTPTNHINYSSMGGNRSQSNIKGVKKLDQVPYKYYRQTKSKNQGKGRIRPMTSQTRSHKVIMKSDRSKEILSQNYTMNDQYKIDRHEHGAGYGDMQQANIHTSDQSETDTSMRLQYVPKTILGMKKGKRKPKKKIIIMKKKTRPMEYREHNELISDSTGGKHKNRNGHFVDFEESSSLKGLYQKSPGKDSKEQTGDEESLTPLGNKMNLGSEGNDYNKSGSSVLVPLADQDSMFSPKNTEEDHFEEENEKATVIQRMYREKLQKRKEEEQRQLERQEEEEKATIIQRKYRKKLEERKIQEEQNEKAAMIQKMYRAKKTKQQLLDEKHAKEENEKAIVIQRMYRKKIETKKKVERKPTAEELASPVPKLIIRKPVEEEEQLKEENEKAIVIQRMYRNKKKNEKKKEQVDEILGVPIDEEMHNKATYIQKQFRK